MEVSTRQLRAFRLVAQHRNFTRAAEALFITPSGLSVLIRELESRVGFRLFDRTTRHVELTPHGRQLLVVIQQSLQELDAAIADIGRSAKGSHELISLGTTPLVAANILAPAMHEFRKLRPELRIQLFDAELPTLIKMVEAGKLDMSLGIFKAMVDVRRPEPTFDLGYEIVDREPLIVLMPSDHRLTTREAIHPWEFVGEIFIGGSNKATVLRRVTEDYLRSAGLDIKLDHGVDNLAMAMSLVASTRGLALMPAYAKNLLPWSVVSRPLAGEAPVIALAVGYSKANTSPILKVFLSRLGELTSDLPALGSPAMPDRSAATISGNSPSTTA
jgi:LysR family hca operon transcriptional activator